MTIGTTTERTSALAGEGPAVIRIDEGDNVAVALRPLGAGTPVGVGGETIVARQDIPAGHKIALSPLAPDQAVTKYGVPIGLATAPIVSGDWVHSHNLRTSLSGLLEYAYNPRPSPQPPARDGARPAFQGYRRSDGRVGTRNELWVLNTVGCVNHAADRIAKLAGERFAGRVDGVHAFAHPYGCSQLGDDLKNTQRVLAGLLRHPNAGGVLVLGLGCENNQLDDLLRLAGPIDRDRVAFFNTQDVIDEARGGHRGGRHVDRPDQRRPAHRVFGVGSRAWAQMRRLRRLQRHQRQRSSRAHRGSPDLARWERAAHRSARDVRRGAAADEPAPSTSRSSATSSP